MGLYDSLHQALGLQRRNRGGGRLAPGNRHTDAAHRPDTPKAKRHSIETLAGPPRALRDPEKVLGHPPRPRKARR